jgi:hypothetical protein
MDVSEEQPDGSSWHSQLHTYQSQHTTSGWSVRSWVLNLHIYIIIIYSVLLVQLVDTIYSIIGIDRDNIMKIE